LAHFGLISIHPFEDGNGTTARLIADMILNLTGFAADGMITLSKVLHDDLPAYYEALREAQGEDFSEEIDASPFVVYHTDALAKAAVMLEEQAISFDQMRKQLAPIAGAVLNQRQVNGLMFMATIRPISTSHYARLTGTSQATALSDLSELVERGLAVREGAGRSTRYTLSQSIAERIETELGEEGDTTG
jgi:Fic family protein